MTRRKPRRGLFDECLECGLFGEHVCCHNPISEAAWARWFKLYPEHAPMSGLR